MIDFILLSTYKYIQLQLRTIRIVSVLSHSFSIPYDLDVYCAYDGMWLLIFYSI